VGKHRWGDEPFIEQFLKRHGRLEECMTAMHITTVTRAQLRQAIRRVARWLLA
jgi:hypothetical protein